MTIERHKGDRGNYSFQGKMSPNIRLRLCGYRFTGSVCDGQMRDHFQIRLSVRETIGPTTSDLVHQLAA